MPLSLTRQQFVYEAGGTLYPLYATPVIVNRAPATNDFVPAPVMMTDFISLFAITSSITLFKSSKFCSYFFSSIFYGTFSFSYKLSF